MGRPSKYETHVKDRLIAVEGWAREGLTDEQIAHNLGINKSTLYEYKKKYIEFSNALKINKDIADFQVENALYQSALEGNTTAQIFWLKNRKATRWRDKQDIEHSGGTTDTIIDVSKMSDEQIKKYLKEVESDE